MALSVSATPQPDSSTLTEGQAAGRGAWLALTAALLGWMFDGAEMGVFSLVGRPALKDLMSREEAFAALAGADLERHVALWLGVITAVFLVGAATGGVLFGWLGDRIGRVRAMTLSVLCYAVFTSLCGIAASPLQLGVFRFIASLGMGGEWSLGVALVMEVWPNRSRAFMAGLIGAAANVGYLMVAIVGLGLSTLLVHVQQGMLDAGVSQAWVDHLTANQGWRLMMILGIAPALLTFFIRLFVPESSKWQEEKESGSTSHWATQDLIGVFIGALGPGLLVYLYAFPSTGSFEHTMTVRLVATVLGVLLAVVGYTYPVLRYLQRLHAAQPAGTPSEAGPTIRRMLLAACLSGVALLGTWGGTQQAPAWADKLVDPPKPSPAASLPDGPPGGGAQAATVTAANPAPRPHAKEFTLIWLSIGAIVGTIGAALAGDWLGRRKAYFLLCLLSFGSVVLLFQFNRHYGNMLLFSAFVAGTFTASFYGWLPLYLPELFRTNVRATGQGFGFNFGRILAAVGSFQLGALVAAFEGGLTVGPITLAGGYPSACTILSTVYAVGMVLIWFAPETRGQPLPD
ncbi:MAG: MFS transporter [Pirellulaceae bacterium]